TQDLAWQLNHFHFVILDGVLLDFFMHIILHLNFLIMLKGSLETKHSLNSTYEATQHFNCMINLKIGRSFKIDVIVKIKTSYNLKEKKK
ncbi:hypothetical protein ACJX0J_039913, partial [Zea mays]